MLARKHSYHRLDQKQKSNMRYEPQKELISQDLIYQSNNHDADEREAHKTFVEIPTSPIPFELITESHIRKKIKKIISFYATLFLTYLKIYD